MENLDMLAVGAGAVLLVTGWLLYYAALSVVGAVLFGAAGVALGFGMIELFKIATPWDMVLLGTLGIVIGLLGVWILHTFHKLAMFIGGFVGGIAVGWLSMEPISWIAIPGFDRIATPEGGAIWCVACALVGALLATMMDWLVIAVVSSALGAWLVCHGLELPPLAESGLVVGGLVVQVTIAAIVKGRGKRGADKEPAEE
jgi:hypothetical protein